MVFIQTYIRHFLTFRYVLYQMCISQIKHEYQAFTVGKFPRMHAGHTKDTDLIKPAGFNNTGLDTMTNLISNEAYTGL